MTTKAVRGIKEEEWAEIKALASTRGMPISRFLVKAVEGAKKEGLKKRWENLLSFRLKDPRKADAIEAAVKDLRKGFRLREWR